MKVSCVLFIVFFHPLVASAGTPTCDDLSAIDFGECAAVLGVGVIGGSCQAISGCESPVPLFTTLIECQDACEATCDDLSGVDFGPCDAVLGVGVIAGACTEISGCESPVPLFSTFAACEAACGKVSVPGTGTSVPGRLLGLSHPNPVRVSTRIPFRVVRSGRVQLELFDVTGRLVRSLVDEVIAEGDRIAEWDRRDDSGRMVRDGVYFIRLTTAGRRDTKRIVVQQ